ncbi:hypothetical protein KSX_47090 [Ktedonospora formicarum]|uniref:Uncharacterized protein n=1 Tax=Ktedonospora formicarum TaxID=2778364 RepID=A0A8J3I2S7_9CHLR|nr:hypothetical protein KSX_47090 [Ktedonospora formicarum]
MTMRFGVLLYRSEYESAASLVQAIEQQVRTLSQAPSKPI